MQRFPLLPDRGGDFVRFCGSRGGSFNMHGKLMVERGQEINDGGKGAALAETRRDSSAKRRSSALNRVRKEGESQRRSADSVGARRALLKEIRFSTLVSSGCGLGLALRLLVIFAW